MFNDAFVNILSPFIADSAVYHLFDLMFEVCTLASTPCGLVYYTSADTTKLNFALHFVFRIKY